MKHGLLTYWHTLRYLKLKQLYERVIFNLLKPRIDTRPSPYRRQLSGKWEIPVQRKPSLLGTTQFFFLNEMHDVDECGWDNPDLEKLWRYNLHYFDDLNARDADKRFDNHQKLMSRWIKENPPGCGTAWEPYPTSLRIVNWIKWALTGNILAAENLSSLATQIRWLSKRLEYHLLGNHLFANAKALVFAGLFFEGEEASDWLKKGTKILKHEIPEQILEDGGQFELSPMYHALALEDMLDLWNITSAYRNAVPQSFHLTLTNWKRTIVNMFNWLSVMSHPDGEISYFNDAAFGIAPRLSELCSYATRLKLDWGNLVSEGITYLKSSGYVRMEQKNTVAILDIAKLGPNYIPGHAHADTLSFELSLLGQRVLVNSGTSCYWFAEDRHRQRGTPAHNTVTINGKNSSEVWSRFRVARRAYPKMLQLRDGDEMLVNACHNGYRWLSGKPAHYRQWRLTENRLTIDDCITGEFQQAQARFHLHPSVQVEEFNDMQNSSSRMMFRLPDGQKIYFFSPNGFLQMENTTWHPEFGSSVPNICVAVGFLGRELRTEIQWNDPAL